MTSSKAGALLWAAALLSSAVPSAKEQLFLVVVASAATPSEIAEKASELVSKTKGGLVMQTSDCGDKRNIFGFAADLAASREQAEAALGKLRTVVPDAYVKSCSVKPGSLLAVRVPAVDLSIAQVPKDAVNWSDEDRISTSQALPDGRTFVIERYYVKDPDDPLEGRRERIVLASSSSDKIVLEEQCASPSRAETAGRRIAFSCAREQAGDNILHSVAVFDASGSKLKQVPHCRNPRWSSESALICDAESVGPDGKLTLKASRIILK